jgi:UDP-galactopyranose mutase
MFRYNNQDHSMLTAMLTVQNIADGTAHDIWDVNVEEDYHEEVSARRPAGHDVAPAVDAASPPAA